MSHRFGACAGVLLLSAGVHAQPASPIEAKVQELAGAHAGFLVVSSIGQTAQGRPIHLLRLSNAGEAGDLRPAVAIIAGVHPQHTAGVETALAMAGKLATEHAAALENATVYIVPLLNPDTYAWHQDRSHPAMDFPRTFTPDDADRDGRTDEDGPQDLNGDGLVTMMRIENPAPGSGYEATHMPDPDDPRLMREPDRNKGERATHALLVEGRDVDGDGKIAEDGPGGVDLDLNFPAHWPEFQDGSGRYQLSEPESLALARWLLERPNVIAALVFAPGDTIVSIPPTGRFDESGRVPIGIEDDDKPLYEDLSKVFKEITRITGGERAEHAGRLHSWMYAHLGLITIRTPVSVRPDLIQKNEEKKDEAKEGAAKPDEAAAPEAQPAEPIPGMPSETEIQARMAEFTSATPERQAQMRAEFEALPAGVRQALMARFTGGGQPGSPPGGPPRANRGAPVKADASDDVKWLALADERGGGFHAWTAFDHPQLGKLEIGGFDPGFRLGVPPGETDRLADEQARFTAAMIGKFPRVRVQGPTAQRVDTGVWRIAARIVNDGLWPTRPAIGVKARRLSGGVLRLDLPQERILSGERVRRVPVIAGSGGSVTQEWLVSGAAGESIAVRFSTPEFGEIVTRAVLQEGQP